MCILASHSFHFSNNIIIELYILVLWWNFPESDLSKAGEKVTLDKEDDYDANHKVQYQSCYVTFEVKPGPEIFRKLFSGSISL